MNDDTQMFDVCIIGGGMVGATLACILGEQNFSVAIIEPHPVRQVDKRQRFDLRVSAITQASQNIFAGIDVWTKILSLRAAPFREMHVWEDQQRSQIHFDSAELGEPTLGHIVENSVITQALYSRLDELPQVQLFSAVRCQHITPQQTGQLVRLDDGQQIRAQLLVGADGSRSWLRQQLGITIRGWDYDHAALVTYVKTQQHHAHTAWQRFLPNGPLAFLPLTEGYSSIVWSTQPQHAESLCTIDKEQFVLQLEEAFAARLGAVIEVGPRASYPLRFLVADKYVAPGIALVGDSAHTMHPLAGQGVNLGLADAASLAEVLVNARHKHQSIHSLACLRHYERWRKAENMSMLVGVDAIQRLYAMQMPWLRTLRQTGMQMVHRLAPLKNRIISHAMGRGGDLPKLARGITLS